MQIVEVKNDIAKIVYNPSENHLLPADFLLVEDINQKIIAQIIKIESEKDSINNIADIKLSLCLDKEENLSYYSGYIPAKDSKIIYINPDEILELIKNSDSNIFLGTLSNRQDCYVKVPFDFIDDNLYIQSDRKDNTAIITKNIISELNVLKKNIIIVDFDGSYNNLSKVKRIKITNNFRLPLNIEAFNTIYENDLTDCPSEDKAIIQSIILELREYLTTLKDKFLPFTLFKNVVEDELLQNQSSGLMFLRNKLWLYAQDNLFAETKSQFDILNESLEEKNILLIDASDIEEKWFNFIIHTLINNVNKDCYLITSLDDIKPDKKLINNLYNTKNIIPIVSSSYQKEITHILESLCHNRILFKKTNEPEETEPALIFAEKLNAHEFIIIGEATLYLPLILDLQEFDATTKQEVVENDIKKDIDNMLSSTNKIVPKEAAIKSSKSKKDQISDKEDNITEDDLNSLDELQESGDLIVDENIEKINKYDVFDPEPEIVEDIPEIEDIIDEIDNKPNTDEQKIQESEADLLDNISELDSTDILEEVNPEQETTSNTNTIKNNLPTQNEEDLIDIDTESLEEDDNKIEEKSENIKEQKENSDNIDEIINNIETEANEQPKTTQQKEEDLTDINTDSLEEYVPISEENTEKNIQEQEKNSSDIDDIINNIETEAKEKAQQETNEQIKENTTEKNVLKEENQTAKPSQQNKHIQSPTVYETDKSVGLSPEELPFKVGDRVFHPKHGKGIIEGFTNYSNKILFCQIEFENVGRRILDPKVAGIEKI